MNVRYTTLDKKGFTFLEILVAMVVLSIGFLGIAAVTASVVRGNSFSNRLTTATTLAQERMEDIRRLGYSGIPTADTTTVEDYHSIANYPLYKRVACTNMTNPADGMKMVTVTVYWGSDAHSVSLRTILAE
jgi:type IV pilus assembly protein PilV